MYWKAGFRFKQTMLHARMSLHASRSVFDGNWISTCPTNGWIFVSVHFKIYSPLWFWLLFRCWNCVAKKNWIVISFEGSKGKGRKKNSKVQPCAKLCKIFKSVVHCISNFSNKFVKSTHNGNSLVSIWPISLVSKIFF